MGMHTITTEQLYGGNAITAIKKTKEYYKLKVSIITENSISRGQAQDNRNRTSSNKQFHRWRNGDKVGK